MADKLSAVLCSLDRVDIATEFFDASIIRIAAWVIGVRSTQKALLFALWEPTHTLRNHEQNGEYTSRLATLEEAKALPWGAVWNKFCDKHDIPTGLSWLEVIHKYEAHTLSKGG
ncbi:MAG: hypothetical protein GF344_20125 [Chitinivibrionales bacterium]|nr:hypothetical protein [Chitinivibrionales bacterium]MBD3358922.1 hypothetical protein [Chitinivibrionales bacterium]